MLGSEARLREDARRVFVLYYSIHYILYTTYYILYYTILCTRLYRLYTRLYEDANGYRTNGYLTILMFALGWRIPGFMHVCARLVAAGGGGGLKLQQKKCRTGLDSSKDIL